MLVKLCSETPGQHGPERKNSPSDGLRAVRPLWDMDDIVRLVEAYEVASKDKL
jgi:hypothetical protein